MSFFLLSCEITSEEQNTVEIDLGGETIIGVSLGSNHSSALTSTGRVFTWGHNYFYQLGDGTNIDRYTPTEITNQFDLNNNESIISLSLGSYHSSALTSFGRIFTWGSNDYGQLGDGSTIQRITPKDVTQFFDLYEDESIIKISLGSNYSSALTSLGRLFTWGFNMHGQLGNNSTEQSFIPIDITEFFSLNEVETLVDMSLGTSHSVALTSSGRVFTWGSNQDGELGTGYLDNDFYPLLISTPTEITDKFNLSESETIISMSAGHDHTLALSSTGRIFSWGSNEFGQLGVGIKQDQIIPMDISSKFSLYAEENVVEMSLGTYLSVVLTSTGRIFTWGFNYDGQLGDGTYIDKDEPIDITEKLPLHGEEKITYIIVGSQFVAILTSEGRMVLWGQNYNGQLGNGKKTDFQVR